MAGNHGSYPLLLGEQRHEVQFSYDPRYNIAYISFHKQQAEVESIKVSDELIVDMTPDGTIYGIELLNANNQLLKEEANILEVINEATGEHVELTLPLES